MYPVFYRILCIILDTTESFTAFNDHINKVLLYLKSPESVNSNYDS